MLLALATLCVAGCGSSSPNLPNGGKGLLGSQPLNGNPGTGKGAPAGPAANASKGQEAQSMAGAKAADKAEGG
jgi:hypothetical protein